MFSFVFLKKLLNCTAVGFILFLVKSNGLFSSNSLSNKANEKLIHLKNVICPILEIEYFNGTYDFGEKLPSIDESLPIKGQQRKNDHFSEIKNGMISQMLNSINYRKEELLEKEHSMV